MSRSIRFACVDAMQLPNAVSRAVYCALHTPYGTRSLLRLSGDVDRGRAMS